MGLNSARQAGLVGSVCGASVPLTAVDIVVIAQALSIEPTLFARLVPAALDDDRASFVLDSCDARYQLAMRVPCPFVLRMNDGSAFCGLSATRPVCWRRDNRRDLAVHTSVVDRWNAVATRASPESGLGLADVCRYVMEAVDDV